MVRLVFTINTPNLTHLPDLLAIDHELVRRPYIPKLSEEQDKAFLKDYYILLKDVLGVKVEQLSVDELCTYTLSQMDVLTRNTRISPPTAKPGSSVMISFWQPLRK